MKNINLNSIAVIPAVDTVNNVVLVANTAQTVDLSIAGAKGATHVIINSTAGGVLARMDGVSADIYLKGDSTSFGVNSGTAGDFVVNGSFTDVDAPI